MKHKKIIVRMAAGLANRMFQYSYSIYLKKNGYDVYIDNDYKPSKWEHENILWEKIFPHAPLEQAPVRLIFQYGGGYDLFSKIRRHYLKFTSKVYLCPNPFTVPSDELLGKYGYIIGVCHNAKMVETVKEEISRMFQFDEFVDKRNRMAKGEMISCNSVAVHVRKGKDYMQNVKYQTCGFDYYNAAIDLIKNKVENPKFFVFTDNAEWVKKNLTFFDYELVNYNPAIGWGNHFDMQLMSNCKHNIIANSTYSWWGAFLNRNPSKIVIAPAKWFNSDNEILNSDLAYCNNWILL